MSKLASYAFCTCMHAQTQIVISLVWVFQTCELCWEADCRLHSNYQVWKGGRTFKAHNTKQDCQEDIMCRINNATISRVPRCCLQTSVPGTSFGGLGLTLNIVIKVILMTNLFYLFKQVSQNDASPKIRSPNRGKNW